MTVWTPPTNAIRAEWGANAIATNPDDNEDETNLADVLANLMHWAYANGVNWAKASSTAANHFDHEIMYPTKEGE